MIQQQQQQLPRSAPPPDTLRLFASNNQPRGLHTPGSGSTPGETGDLRAKRRAFGVVEDFHTCAQDDRRWRDPVAAVQVRLPRP